MLSKNLWLIVLFSVLVLPPAVLPGQKPSSSSSPQNPLPFPTPKSEEQEPVRIFTEEVRLPIVALDQYGHYDPTLEADDVLVLEDGVAQQIKSVQQLPVNVLLLLDVGNLLCAHVHGVFHSVEIRGERTSRIRRGV